MIPLKDKFDSYMNLMLLAEKWYPPKKLQHAIRVAKYAYEEAKINELISDPIDAATVGLAHDLLEDTQVPPEALEAIINNPALMSDILLVTKDDNVSYNDYIMEIINNKESMPIAFVVKKADMKDHMSQTDTLTDKLKNKYLPVLHYFL